MGKAQIIRRIHNSAKKYKQYFVGNTYMFVYENEFIEVISAFNWSWNKIECREFL